MNNIAKQLGGLVDKAFAASRGGSGSSSARLMERNRIAKESALSLRDAAFEATRGGPSEASRARALERQDRNKQLKQRAVMDRANFRHSDPALRRGIVGCERKYSLIVATPDILKNAFSVEKEAAPLVKRRDQLISNGPGFYLKLQQEKIERGEVTVSETRSPEQIKSEWRLNIKAHDAPIKAIWAKFNPDYLIARDRFIALAKLVFEDLRSQRHETYSAFGIALADDPLLMALESLINVPEQLDPPPCQISPLQSLANLGILKP